MLKPLVATAAAGLTLFIWGGITQMFPWGPSTAHVISTETSPDLGAFHLRTPVIEAPGSLGTAAFDEAFSGRLGLLFTDNTVSWISSMPIAYYDGAAYLTRQAVTQAVVAALIVALLILLAPLGPRRSLSVIALSAVSASVATYGVLSNWWGLAPAYAVGESANLIVGWTIAATAASFILSRKQGGKLAGTAYG
ncbi:hypothetical protein [Litoreibacter roseus]|uniref:Uncharacterized protein n=1 Tax=Litoreibacter roseus TaxID=2601869 RepID=A0A6N6JG46_9RHOB|nr:hypothetical protein [Litoreibacter roseus]GFE65104.1 hypothetical protein KIN_21780 [Litoreibacter roseus]